MLNKECPCLFLICFLLIGCGGTSVPFIKPCRAGDRDCLLAANLQIAIPYIADGITELGITAVEPMNLKNVTLDQGYFKLIFPDMKVVGTRKCKVVEAKQNIQESTLKLTLDCPFEATGKYVFTGKVCFFDVNDEGNYRLQTDSIRTTITSKIEKINGKDGNKYWNLTGFEYVFEPIENMHFGIENVFSGNVGKAQPLLDLLNKDWRGIASDFGKPYVDPVAEHFYGVFKTFFLRFPIEQLI